MFSIKMLNETNNINVSYILKSFFSQFTKSDQQHTKVLSDDKSIEVVTGKENFPESGQVVVELTFRKNIIINISDLENEDKTKKQLAIINYLYQEIKKIEEAVTNYR